jgi:inosose dehydratase
MERRALQMGTRRQFLAGAAGLAAGAAWGGWPQAFGKAAALPNPVGYSVISWPQAQFQHALSTISTLGFSGVQLLGWVTKESAGESASTLKARLDQLKLQPVALSAWGVDPGPEEDARGVAVMRTDVAYQKALGGRYIQITDGGKPNADYTDAEVRAMGGQMNALGRMAAANGLVLGYHPHFGTYGETRRGLGRVLEATDPHLVKLIVDVAHLTLGGSDPAEVIRTYRERMILMHIKDVRRDVLAQARQNPDLVRHARYHFCELLQGGVNYPAVIAAMRQTDYRGWVIVELDGYQVPAGGPDTSARENRDAMRKMGFRV